MKKRVGNDLMRHSQRSAATQFRDKAAIQVSTKVKTDVGDFNETWTDTAEGLLWVGITPASESQIMKYKSQNVKAVFLVKIRREEPVSEANRLRIPEVKRGEVVITAERFFEIKTSANMQNRGIMQHVIGLENRT